MKKCWKWLSTLIGAVVLLFIITVVAVTFLIDPNQFKPVLITQLKQLTGFEVNIPGKLSWSFFPHLGMEVDEMEVKQPSQFTATVKNLVLRVKIAPLLHQQLEFSKASISQLQFNQLQASDIKARMHFKNQELQLHPLTAVFYQGNLHSDISVSLKQASPVIHAVSELKNVDMASLIQGLSGGKHSKLVLEGQGAVTSDLNTQGKTVNELLGQLNGKGNLSIDKGILKGIDIGYYVDTATALLNKQSLPSRLPGNQTEFGRLTGTAIIKNGVLYNDDLLLESTLYTTKGKGSIDLVNNTLDYHLEVTIKVGQTNNKILAMAGKPIPIHVSGNLSNPTVALDTFALMQEVGQEQLQQIGDKIQKALPEKANKFLQKLFH